MQAQENVDAAETWPRDREGRRPTRDITRPRRSSTARSWSCLGVTTYIPEPAVRAEAGPTSRRNEKPAVLNNRRGRERDYGKRLQRLRSERVERTFAHVCDTGGGRRSWLRGIENVRKRYLIAAAAHNLGLILRKLFGVGKPRAYAAILSLLQALQNPRLSSGRCYAEWRAANYPHAAPRSRRCIISKAAENRNLQRAVRVQS